MLKSLEFLKDLQDSIEYLTRIDYVPRETREEVINSLINEYLNDDYKINEIKQDLEKYSNVMYLLKDLFTLLYVGYEFDEYCQNDNYFIREYGPSSGYLITEDLYLVLKQLEKLVGDNHD